MTLSYEYDEADETWPFFLLTVVLMAVIPGTLTHLYRLVPKSQQKKSGQENDDSLTNIESKYVSDDIAEYRKHHAKEKSLFFNRQTLFLVLGWAAVAYLVQRIANSEHVIDTSLMFDPYELLDIATSATDREIRSAYRKLSVKFHPDKLSKDLGATERTQIEEQYVLITKAYKALTDEVTRNNYLKYGHPDGPQSTSHGIALPKFLIEGTMSPVVVIGYIALLAVVLPFFVSRWWANTQSYTGKGLNTETASYFVGRLFNNKPSEVITVKTILNWLANAKEYRLKYPHISVAEIEKLLNDHIERKHSGDLESIKLDVVAKSVHLLHGLLDISTTFRNTDVSDIILNTLKSLIQATHMSPYSQILQLPNVNKEIFMDNNSDNIRTLGKLFTYDDKKIGEILGISDKNLLNDTLKVASNIPHLRLIKAEFKVPGEPFVTPHSTPHIVLKLLVHSAKHKAIPPEFIPEEKLQEPQDFESLKDPFAITAAQPLVPKTFAPYFPGNRNGGWCCLLVLQKDGKVAQTPFVVTRLSFANLQNDFDKRAIKEISKDSFNSEKWEVGTIKIPIGQPAPSEPGEYSFRVIIKSTEYFGGDLDITIPMRVRDPASIKKSEEEEDKLDQEEENDENTDDDDIDEDDDDDQEDNDESDYTDIDTDTEVEEDTKD